MSYASDDPRSRLETAPATTAKSPAAAPDPNAPIAAPEIFDFSRTGPDETSPAGSRSWIVRAQNVVLFYTRAVPGERLTRNGQQDEYMMILPHDDAKATLTAGEHTASTSGKSIAVVPPGDSEITVHSATDVVRLFTVHDPELARRARNADSYAAPHPRASLLDEWPEPVGGHRLRVYGGIADIERSSQRLGRIFRSRAFMANFLYHYDGPRDPGKLSPHHHDDFEQVSLAVSGEFVHHIRTPWTGSRMSWREDEHHRVGSPSVAIIPPPTVHTTEASGHGRNQLLDIFAGPRRDFSARAGWVLNAEDYPEPDDLEVRG
ncbi:hypothetical protein [Streptomyces rapamycinicus]|uniref:Cupin 2 conserved barrel domain-containing protein n=2 Tax=Streptomyces rapamycinicus TaxID=1226757 RepID=A0A0A0NTI5_STRRN|nr:hypothetical protein [Streptomyces rapamycinicus]AGP60599.1 hypothetical protein M271_46170 [Streptomyces rapamycinicus NRRL 5491]MBB4788233.1 mannose-6-phosphate isomerase-like protein (cupin superfamily) [Streptomyces rapamycinicus]RLV72568.1 hypothetical protein D3C57_148615 [Streptomyces rapamycinicus NRRL 5491]UTP36154.1 hypothetical protein LIV37_46915 [Streptomyces rapamycinicus NRRL 5491]